jgi:hypothetical protein
VAVDNDCSLVRLASMRYWLMVFAALFSIRGSRPDAVMAGEAKVKAKLGQTKSRFLLLHLCFQKWQYCNFIEEEL